METDRYSIQNLRKDLENIIDADELILQSLIFFSQDIADVSDSSASSIIDKVKSPRGQYKEYEFMKIVFERINREIESLSSRNCCTIIAKLSGEQELVCHMRQGTPLPTSPNPDELSYKLLFDEFPKRLDIEFLEKFALLGLKMPHTEYKNVTHDKRYPYNTKAVLEWWRGTQGNGYKDPPPSYTRSGLIEALEKVRLTLVIEWVKQYTPS